jgi:hypothetical protein
VLSKQCLVWEVVAYVRVVPGDTPREWRVSKPRDRFASCRFEHRWLPKDCWAPRPRRASCMFVIEADKMWLRCRNPTRRLVLEPTPGVDSEYHHRQLSEAEWVPLQVSRGVAEISLTVDDEDWKQYSFSRQYTVQKILLYTSASSSGWLILFICRATQIRAASVTSNSSSDQLE